MMDRFLHGGYIALLMLWGYLLLSSLVENTVKGVTSLILVYWKARQEFLNNLVQVGREKEK